MANRSYLYSVDFNRTLEERNDDKKVCGLSEWSYEIPLAYKILVSQGAKLSPSVIFEYDKPIAIIGNFRKGREKLFLFLEELLKTNLLDNDELKRQINEAREYLYDVKNEAEYIILECGEIYQMEHEDIEEANKNLFENEILKIDKIIEDFMMKIQNMPNGSESEKKQTNQKKLDLLGIGFWDNALYYQ